MTDVSEYQYWSVTFSCLLKRLISPASQATRISMSCTAVRSIKVVCQVFNILYDYQKFQHGDQRVIMAITVTMAMTVTMVTV